MMINIKRKLMMVFLASLSTITVSSLIVACSNNKSTQKSQIEKQEQKLDQSQQSKTTTQSLSIKDNSKLSLVKNNNQYNLIVNINGDNNKFLELVLKEKDSNKFIRSNNRSKIDNNKASFVFNNLDPNKSYLLDSFIIYESKTAVDGEQQYLNQDIKDKEVNIKNEAEKSDTASSNSLNEEITTNKTESPKPKVFSLNAFVNRSLASAITLQVFINGLSENERLENIQPNNKIVTYIANIKDQLDTLYSTLKEKNEQVYNNLISTLFDKYKFNKSDQTTSWETIAKFFEDLIKTETELVKHNTELQNQERLKVLVNKPNTKIKVFKLFINQNNKLEATLVGAVHDVLSKLKNKQLVFKFKFPNEETVRGMNTVNISNIEIFINQDPVDVKVVGSETLTKSGEYTITHVYIKDPNKQVDNIDEANLLANPFKITKP
ncbi:hypothetical protein JM47_03170 [Ureaplasma diversum]|uniref:Lipoprotein n=2 Tax=Ureaplasma diversum TaxID=42094 RepID=A0A0C5RCA5_9BACT|nr:hypothetical protein JM47_03170 [Ureaplasma diversum]